MLLILDILRECEAGFSEKDIISASWSQFVSMMAYMAEICAMIALAASAIYPNLYVALASPFLVTLLDQVIRILIPMDWNWILYTGGLLFSVRADYIDLHDLLITPWVWSGICIVLFVWRVRRRVRDGEFA